MQNDLDLGEIESHIESMSQKQFNEMQNNWAMAKEAQPKYMTHFRSEDDRRNAIKAYAKELEEEDRVVKEESLSSDKNWIEASKALHKYINGYDIEGDDATIAKYGLDEMGKFNYNLGSGTIPMAMNIDKATDEQKMALFYMMETYDAKDITMSGVGRFFEGIATDPTTYLFGAGLMTKVGSSGATKEGFKAALKAKVASIVNSKTTQGMAAGATYTGIDDALRQEVAIGADYMHEYDPTRGAIAMSIGAVAGGVLTNVVPITKAITKETKGIIKKSLDNPIVDMATISVKGNN